MVALAPHGIARLDEAHLDARVLAFSFGLSLATGVIFGLAPAIRISREVNSRRQTAGIDWRGMRRAFVAAEVALAVVLLTGAGLLIRSFAAVQSVDPGFQTARVLAATLRFRNTLPRDKRAALYREAMTRIGQAPGVSAAGGTSAMFFTGDQAKFGLRAVEELLRRGHRLAVLNRGKSEAALPSEVAHLQADRRDDVQVRAALAGREFDAIVDVSCYSEASARLMVNPVMLGVAIHTLSQGSRPWARRPRSESFLRRI